MHYPTQQMEFGRYFKLQQQFGDAYQVHSNVCSQDIPE